MLLLAQVAEAHPGRRFEIQLVNNQLVAQGVNTGASDGAPDVRVYQNVIHDHWANSPLIGVDSATAAAPEFDIPVPALALQFRPIELRLLRVTKWIDPPVMPAPGTTPSFESLSNGEVVRLSLGGQSIDSNSLGSLFLTSSVPPEGLADIQISYTVNRSPLSEIYVLELELSSSNPAINVSGSAYILLSPDGSSPQQKLHHASLYLEEYLGAGAVPEPDALIVALVGILALAANARNGSLRRGATP
jgi:hypothetical protein